MGDVGLHFPPRCIECDRVEKIMEVWVLEDPHRDGRRAVREPSRLGIACVLGVDVVRAKNENETRTWMKYNNSLRVFKEIHRRRGRIDCLLIIPRHTHSCTHTYLHSEKLLPGRHNLHVLL